jgi:phage terminase large subunit-like protein
MSEDIGLKLSLLDELERQRIYHRDRNRDQFIPGEPTKTPFAQQLAFFKCDAFIKMARCGNRAGKTFSTMRDLAWKLMRNHPYNKKWREHYDSSKPKEFWGIGPDYTFCNEVMWDKYLSKFIPEWYYTDPVLNKPMIDKTNQGNIDTVTFRNGDQLKFKSYDQNLTSLMGKAIHHVTLDEMPRNVKLIGEIITRTLDLDGEVSLGFTPLNPVEEIEKFIEENKKVIVFQWSLRDNPHFRDEPERLQRALDAWKHLPKGERESRETGEWYREHAHGRVFAGLDLDVVPDFPIPPYWRQVRFTDPAARVTGLALFAEDPDSGIWYCHKGVELEWKDQRAKAETIVDEIEKYKPYPEFVYTLSRYDNHEAWFGAYAAAVGFTPCILKNREQAQMGLRTVIAEGRLKFFAKGAALAVKQFGEYHYKDNGTINKVNDHVLDCVMYFSREIPSPVSKKFHNMNWTEKHELWANHLKRQEDANRISQNDSSRNIPRFSRSGSLASLRSRGSR